MLEISPQEVHRRLADLVLLDCREPDEVAICRIDGARHVPMGEIPARLSELDRGAEVVVYCHHGVRSLHVVQFLLKQGFTRARSMSGGIDAWSIEIDPRVPRY
ncbi:MAG: hypothetical protein JNG88_07100 [Phycisphaerales bacterium]|nr:hypothetical protein [Phycisphaerales bacterium]